MRGVGKLVERVGVLRNGKCGIRLDTIERATKSPVVCVANDHAHCTGCYTVISRDSIWCSKECAKSVGAGAVKLKNKKSVPGVKKRKTKGTREQRAKWALKRRRWRTNHSLKKAMDRFIDTYGIAPKTLYVDTSTMPWLGGVEQFFPVLRVVRLPAGVPMEGHAVLYGTTTGSGKVCLSICRLSVGSRKKGEGG